MVNNKKAGKGPATPMETLLGSKLLTNVGTVQPTSTVMKGKDLVLLYFSASWCPPCKTFTPVLTKFYTKYCVPNNAEIVYISSNEDMPSFNTYYGKMPWAALPNTAESTPIKQLLSDSLKITGIPSLVVMEVKTGYFVTDDARFAVSQAAGDESQESDLIISWKKLEAVPIEEAVLSGAGAGRGSFLSKLLSMILTNPMYMIGLFFLVKRGFQKLVEIGKEDEEL